MFASFITKITKKPRYRPTIQWSSKSLVYNMFRVFEAIFGREVGIRPESSTQIFHRNGKEIFVRKFFTTESFLVFIEGCIKEFLNKPKFKYKFQIIPINTLATSIGQLALPSIFSFAIAYDAKSSTGSSGSGTSYSFNHTVTGSNPALFFFGITTVGVGDVSAVTYPKASTPTGLTHVGSDSGNETAVGNGCLYYLANPDTGTNSVTATKNSSAALYPSAVSYSGCNSTTHCDAYLVSKSSGSVASIAPNLTIVTANSWTGLFSCISASEPTAGSNTTKRDYNGSSGNGIYDSNGVASGSFTMNLSGTQHYVYAMFTIMPYVSAGNTYDSLYFAGN